MPYVSPERRNIWHGLDNPGQLNYMITTLIVDYLETNGLSYQTINDVVGALVCAKDEFTRRVVVDYEDRKREDNGDVYPAKFPLKQ
jgi:hypothetical protein